MSDHIEKTLSEFQQQIKALEDELSHKKRVVNDLCEMAGRSIIYHDIEQSSKSHGAIRRDQFYGKPLATAARDILELRDEALTVNEIFDTMIEGGYSFDAKNDDNAKRSLRISLSKNTATFHKLPNGTFGLLEWYPSVKQNGGKSKGPVGGEPEEDDDAMAEELSAEFEEESKEKETVK